MIDEAKEREGFEKAWRKYHNDAEFWQRSIKWIARYFWLERAKKGQEEIERLREGRPKIVCLCGSTRFTKQMLIKQWGLTKEGIIVLSWCALPPSYFDALNTEDFNHIGDKEGVKEAIDELHKRKIDLADEVLVLNVGGYIGQSTKSEIEYAKIHGKIISYLEEAK